MSVVLCSGLSAGLLDFRSEQSVPILVDYECDVAGLLDHTMGHHPDVADPGDSLFHPPASWFRHLCSWPCSGSLLQHLGGRWRR
ncbi:unnamed protein product [Linum trigynum]|uniref:Uncharacterized protein n=1 Tax=Linum trigynum TaxID=586398 RepID=A0AAV2GBB6_9ROSI